MLYIVKSLDNSVAMKVIFLSLLSSLFRCVKVDANTPINDECEHAIVVEVGFPPLKGSTTNATYDENTACAGNGYQNGVGVWHYLQGDGNTITASLCSNETNYDSQLTVYEGSCNDLLCVGGNNDFCGQQSAFAWATRVDTVYFVYVHGNGNVTGNFALSLQPLSSSETVSSTTSENNESLILRPSNDACTDDAVQLENGTLSVRGSTINSTYDDIFNCFGNCCESGYGVWYTFIGSGNWVTASLCNHTYYDSKITVFTGYTCSYLTCLGSNDEACGGLQSEFTWYAAVNTLYYVYIHGYESATGDYELSLSIPPPPLNDQCENAVEIHRNDILKGSTNFSTNNHGIPICDGYEIAYGVWFVFQGDGDWVMASYYFSGVNIRVLEGSSCGDLVCVGGNVQHYGELGNQFTWHAKAGTLYYMYMHGYGTRANGDFELSLQSLSTDSVSDEAEVLRFMYEAFGGDDWYENETQPQHCYWNSISCNLDLDPPRIISIDLTDANLHGTIPTAIGLLSHVEILRLDVNALTSTLPTEVGLLHELRQLGLAGNNINGTVPTEFARLTHLDSLFIGANRFVGTIPIEIGRLTYLREFYADGNTLTGALPSVIGLLTNLRSLDLGHNVLTGILPSDIGQLTNLHTLNLNNNALTGALPSSVGLLRNLAYLELENNALNGNLPSHIGLLTNLRFLRLDNNNLTGTLPSPIGNMRNLAYLALQNNALSGNIPSSIGLLRELRFIYLDSNSFTGILPSEIGLLNSTLHLYLSNNDITGSIPPQISQLGETIRQLHLSRNDFTGSIPIELGYLFVLEELFLDDNKLSGQLPPTFSWLYYLHSLNLSSNRLTGGIPELIYAYALDELSLRNNSLNGTLSMYQFAGNGSNLVVLDISNNRLSSYLVAQELSMIRTLDLSNNNIAIELQNNFFDHLKNAQNIILSNNRIHGQLPNNLNIRLVNLIRLHLDGNCLSGVFPTTYDIDMPRLEELKLSYGGTKCRVLDFNETWPMNYNSSEHAKASELCFGIDECSVFYGDETTWCCGDTPQICTHFGRDILSAETCSQRLYRVGLWGPLPPSISQLLSLRVLTLSNNLLTGELPAELGDGLPRIEDFDITNNYFNGRIPAEISRIGSNSARNSTISVGGNRFNESYLAPLPLCLLGDGFDLYQNQNWCPVERTILNYFFVESKGQEWTNSSHWIDEYESHCRWHGIICDENNGWVTEISLHNNGLSGRITTRIGDLLSLEKLNLNDNDLQGSIPKGIEDLTGLSDVRFSYNSLTGEIPELHKLTNLSILYLHSNRLQGEVQIKSEKMIDMIADCGSPSDFNEPLKCEDCTFCCNYFGECEQTTTVDKPFLLFGECGVENTETLMGLHINSCSIQEGLVFICYMAIICILIFLVSFIFDCFAAGLPFINVQDVDLGNLMGEDSVYLFLMGSNWFGWFIAVLVWSFQIYVYFLFVDASEKILSVETDWNYRFRCARNAIDSDDVCEYTAAVTEIGHILGIAIMVIYLMKDLICALQILWIAPHLNEPLRKRLRHFMGATVLFTISAFAIYSSVVYNQATSEKDTDFIYNSVVLVFLNSFDEWCFTAVQLVFPNWVKTFLREININSREAERQQIIENILKKNEEIQVENQNIVMENEEIRKENEEIKKENLEIKELLAHMRRENEEFRNQILTTVAQENMSTKRLS